MRKKEREVRDCVKIKEIIESCHCCRIGFCDNGRVYIVPLNFGYEEVEGKRIFYFHGASEGRKIDLIQKGNPVGFELDTNYHLKEAAVSCAYSAQYESVIGMGKISFIEDFAQKAHALHCIMCHVAGNREWEFPEASLQSVCIFQLEVEELTCKVHE